MCDVPFCRREPEYVYLGKEVCEVCWVRYCDGELDLRGVLKLPRSLVEVM